MPYIIAIVLIVVVSVVLIVLIDRYYHKRIRSLLAENHADKGVEFKYGWEAGMNYVLDSNDSHVKYLRDNR